MTKEHKGWQERFDEAFIREDGLLDIGKYDDEAIKEFISSLLAEQEAEMLKTYPNSFSPSRETKIAKETRKEVLEKVRKRLPNEYEGLGDTDRDYVHGFNQCLSEVIEAIKKLK